MRRHRASASGRPPKKGHERGILGTTAADTSKRHSLRQQGLRGEGVREFPEETFGPTESSMHNSRMQKSGSDPAGIEPGTIWLEANSPAVTRPLWLSCNLMRGELCGYGAAPGIEGGGNRRSSRKLADMQHRPGTIPRCENPLTDPTRNRTRIALVGGECSSHSTTVAPLPCFSRGSPLFPTLHSRRCSPHAILHRIARQYIFKSRPNISTQLKKYFQLKNDPLAVGDHSRRRDDVRREMTQAGRREAPYQRFRKGRKSRCAAPSLKPGIPGRAGGAAQTGPSPPSRNHARRGAALHLPGPRHGRYPQRRTRGQFNTRRSSIQLRQSRRRSSPSQLLTYIFLHRLFTSSLRGNEVVPNDCTTVVVLGGRGGIVDRPLASYLGEQCPIPGRAAHGPSYVGIVPEDAAERRVLSGISQAPTFQRRSQDLDTLDLAVEEKSCSSQVNLKLSHLNRTWYTSSPSRLRFHSGNRHSDILPSTKVLPPAERGGAVVTHWTRIRKDPGSIPGLAFLISAFHGSPKSLQVNAGMGS
ncbi:hypothetical protein PR048_026495 [Dryococelus australis]|uniref:Uncharacterized protein n=1 Tax=Dryococelus australis TaxID=614101 RepID=A0ABQ9GLJ0_9NEOP|nr:hypothetical protein PR048_026495 [Dryococelus australis]